MTDDQARPSAPPLPPSSSTGGGCTNGRQRRSSTTNDGGDDSGTRRARRSSSTRQMQQPPQAVGNNRDGSQQQRRSNNRDSRSNSSRRQPPVELAMSFHTASNQPLPPPPPISAGSSGGGASSSSSRRLQASASAPMSSVGTNQPKSKKHSSQTSGVAAEGMGTKTAASRSSSRSRSNRPPSRSSSGIQDDEDDGTAANVSLSQLAAEANATEAELERRRSRLAEIRRRSDASQYELTIQEEAKKIRRLQKTQRKLKERMMRIQQQQQNLDVEAPLDFSGGLPTANRTGQNKDKKNKQKTKSNNGAASRTAASSAANITAAAAAGRGSESSHGEEAIVRRSSSRMTTDTAGTGTANASSSKRNKNRNSATAGNQQQLRQNSATIATVPAATTYASSSARSSMASDEALARKLQNEMLKEQEAVRAMEQQFQDEEMARSLAAAEAARMTSLGLSPNDMMDDGDIGRRRSSRGGGCCNTVHRMISCVIMAGCIGVVLFVLFGIVYKSAGGDVESLPPWFRDSWGQGWEGDYGGQNANSSDFQRWRIGRDKKGLKLTLIDGLSDDWKNHFYQAIEDWNGATALQLTTVPDNDGPPCEKHTRGMVKTCNGDYGRTDWTGLNELLFENGWIVSSVAMMNENYLRNARDTERQYVMCHELGHAWGLPHRDEIVGNRDLGTCLDYTITPQNNMKPDEIDFSNLQEMYGEVNVGRRRLRMAAVTPTAMFGGDADVLHVSRYANRTSINMYVDAGKSHRRRGKQVRALLHKSDHAEVWEEDLGQGRRLVTTMLLSQEAAL